MMAAAASTAVRLPGRMESTRHTFSCSEAKPQPVVEGNSGPHCRSGRERRWTYPAHSLGAAPRRVGRIDRGERDFLMRALKER
jgi:hypothetical protein